MASYRKRRVVMSCVILLFLFAGALTHQGFYEPVLPETQTKEIRTMSSTALRELDALAVKGRAPKTDYRRAQFGDGWRLQDGCDMRNIILFRDLQIVKVDDSCKVLRGILNDPYTASQIHFLRGPESSQLVQIDHVVALSNAWQTGAQQLSFDQREDFANDPLNLLAVDGPANQHKGDSDAATWLPPNKSFRCEYVSRQVSVKTKYRLWVTAAEKEAITRVLQNCLK